MGEKSGKTSYKLVLAGGWEEQAAGCHEENGTCDLEAVLVVNKAARHQLIQSCMCKEFQDEMGTKKHFQTRHWIYVISHVEKILKAVQCQMCGNVYK